MVPPKTTAASGSGPTTGEDAALQRIGAALHDRLGGPPEGEVWFGDDAAVVAAPPGPLVLATDAVVGGVHADLDLVGLDDLGWKALTVAVSDLAAMGARPLHALVSLCMPAGTDIDRLQAGVIEAAVEWDCPVVGGDLSSASQVIAVVSVTGTLDPDEGTAGGRADRRGAGRTGPVTRSGASPGDHLYVTGPLGASAAGLRLLRDRRRGAADAGPIGEAGPLMAAHRRPRARLAEGRAARRAGATAMMDVSDGLAIDLHRLADASGVGFRLDRVPLAAGTTLDEALGGGEDYELVVAAPPGARLEEGFAAAGLRPPVPVGQCTADPVDRTLEGRPLVRAGWQHHL